MTSDWRESGVAFIRMLGERTMLRVLGIGERQVLRNFFDGERLKAIPSQQKKRRIVLKWLAGRFQPGLRYSERQVNDLIRKHHPDFAALRR